MKTSLGRKTSKNKATTKLVTITSPTSRTHIKYTTPHSQKIQVTQTKTSPNNGMMASLTALIQNRQNVSTSSRNATGRKNGLLISNLN
jgi:hypothetical protein